MKPLDELNAERMEKARAVFTTAQIHAWEIAARRDADANAYQPPSISELVLGEFVYTQAWARRKDKLSRAKRDAGDEALRAASTGDDR